MTKNSSSSSKLEMAKKKTTTQDTPSKWKAQTTSIDSYGAQCWRCYKVRYIESKEKYEEIRSESPMKCFECERCEEPGDVDVNFDSPVRWFQDQHGIPKTPQGLKRIVVVRESGDRTDVYYETPQQKRLRSVKEVAKFIQGDKQFKGIKIEDVSFAKPKRMKRPKP